MKKNKLLIAMLAIICIFSIISTSVFAATVTIGSDATANFTNAQFYVLGSSNVTTYSDANGTTVTGSIYPTDLCTVLNATGTYWQVSYPISGGSKTAYCNKANILSNTSYCKSITISANDTVYTKSDMSTTFGTVFSTDTIYMLSPISNGKAQIIYPVSGGYKIGWINASTSSSYTPPNLQNTAYTTQNVFAQSGYTGQCTWFAWGRTLEKLGIALNSQFYGNANTWWNQTTYPSGQTAKDNCLAIFGNTANHVVYVEYVSNGTVYYNEANFHVYHAYDGALESASEANFKTRSGAGNFLGYIYLK